MHLGRRPKLLQPRIKFETLRLTDHNFTKIAMVLFQCERYSFGPNSGFEIFVPGRQDGLARIVHKFIN
jgi:hypothetical protein